MRNISSWSIRNPIPIILLFVLLTLAGVVGFMGMRVNNNPDIAKIYESDSGDKEV